MHPGCSPAGVEPGRMAHFVSCWSCSAMGAYTISSSALFRVWQWCLSGAGALLVHNQCSLRYKGVKWSPWQLGGLRGPLSARSSLSANTKMLLTDNFHKWLCWVSASLYSTLSHASADTCGRTCWHACLQLFLHFLPRKIVMVQTVSILSGFVLDA